MTPPPCTALGPQCRALAVTLRIADLDEDSPAFRDEMGTWLLGHRQHISFGTPFVEADQLLVDATLHVGCRYYSEHSGSASCSAHGFGGPAIRATDAEQHNPKLGGTRFEVMVDHAMTALDLAKVPEPRRALPVYSGNPCAGAPCRTADGTKGGACCRDLVLDVVLPIGEPEEALLRSRTRPFLSKVHRASPEFVECEIISACGYLQQDGVGCALHDRIRPDGSRAKPTICFDWPASGPDYVYHPGCRLIPEARR